MRKYLSIIKMSLSESFQYMYALLFRFLSYFINMFALTCVWKYIYSDSSGIINGYTLTQMIWYMLIADSFSYATSDIPKREIRDDIKSGTIAYKVNKPYNYVSYIFSRYVGDSILKLVLYLLVSILIGTLFVGIPEIHLDLLNIICILLVIVLGMSISGLIQILISLSSFWVEDSTPFHWVYSKFLLIFGIFFPIEMFPKILQPIIKATPVFVILYGPAKLILSFSYDLFFKVIIAQIMYIIIVSLITMIIYKRGVKKLNVNGG